MSTDPDWMAAAGHLKCEVFTTCDTPCRFFVGPYHVGADMGLETGPVCDTREEAAKSFILRNGRGDLGLIFRKPKS